MEFLLKEAEALSLPCFDLVPASKGDRVWAYWGGRRADLPETFPKGVIGMKSAKHFLSVDQELFDQVGLKGRGPLLLAMHTTRLEEESLQNVTADVEDFNKVQFESGTPLTAKSARSLPPLQALTLYGGPAVENWLDSKGLKRWEYDSVGREVEKFYGEYFNRQNPLLLHDPPFARVGGWHAQWPDDDFYIPREMRLMVWTFQDSEPWYEVFLSPLRNYRIKSRIT